MWKVKIGRLLVSLFTIGSLLVHCLLLATTENDGQLFPAIAQFTRRVIRSYLI